MSTTRIVGGIYRILLGETERWYWHPREMDAENFQAHLELAWLDDRAWGVIPNKRVQIENAYLGNDKDAEDTTRSSEADNRADIIASLQPVSSMQAPSADRLGAPILEGASIVPEGPAQERATLAA